MASLSSVLPAPARAAPIDRRIDQELSSAARIHTTKPKCTAPPYGKRVGWVPRCQADFGDGGAYPEVIVAQFPLDMGRPNQKTGKTVAVQMDNEGDVRFDAILRTGRNKDKTIYSRAKDLIEKQDVEFEKPDDEELSATAERTRKALEQRSTDKLASARPNTSLIQKAKAGQSQEAQFIRYTPANTGGGHNSGASNRVIRMVAMQEDPLDPPKFRRKKIPKGPGSPPVPVMHSPPRNVSFEDQKNWKIPPCVSNWKNAKGHTIPLDKRLAADGRSLQDVQISDNFAKLSDTLDIAMRQAREELEHRSAMQKMLLNKEKREKEERLRQLAQKARMERAGMNVSKEEDDEADMDRREREEIRHDRERERQRDRRLAASGRKYKEDRDRDRDVSEKIALGMAHAKKPSSETMYDQRLFGQSAGVESGFGAEDSYNVYDKPLFGATATSLYTGRGAEEERKSKRTEPVEFEKDQDLFGLDEFLTTAVKGKKAMDKIGRSGTMAGQTGGGGDDSSRKRRMEFESSSSKRDRR
eukprot:Rmarinus@m.16189